MFNKIVSALAVFGGGSLWFAERSHRNVVFVNENNELLAHWPSESIIDGSVRPPECDFYNDTVRFSADMCSHFAISRSANTPSRAAQRAMACAATVGTECILSPEVGFAIPTAFLYDHTTYTWTTAIAPKLLQRDSELAYVRVAPPDGDGVLDTFTSKFNITVSVEFLDGITKQLRVEEFRGEHAFCIQLLRESYEPACWKKLD
jgi:hypothetical protein